MILDKFFNFVIKMWRSVSLSLAKIKETLIVNYLKHLTINEFILHSHICSLFALLYISNIYVYYTCHIGVDRHLFKFNKINYFIFCNLGKLAAPQNVKISIEFSKINLHFFIIGQCIKTAYKFSSTDLLYCIRYLYTYIHNFSLILNVSLVIFHDLSKSLLSSRYVFLTNLLLSLIL